VPHDLGALFTVQQLPEGVPLRLRGYVSASGVPSGGTFASTVTVLSRRREAAAAHAERRRAEPADPARRVRTVGGRPGYEPAIGRWVLPAPTIDPQIVAASARALDRYGPDFCYSHYLAFTNPAAAAGFAAGLAGVGAIAQLDAGRDLLMRLWPSGAGPSERQRKAARFRVRMIGEGGGRRVQTEVSGGDPGYGETSKMLAESALCLAIDDLPKSAGQVTTAVAMGDALRLRLQRAGLSFRVVRST
jgi:short subunit dehydrogenase-like uncharacterized protein